MRHERSFPPSWRSLRHCRYRAVQLASQPSPGAREAPRRQPTCHVHLETTKAPLSPGESTTAAALKCPVPGSSPTSPDLSIAVGVHAASFSLVSFTTPSPLMLSIVSLLALPLFLPPFSLTPPHSSVSICDIAGSSYLAHFRS